MYFHWCRSPRAAALSSHSSQQRLFTFPPCENTRTIAIRSWDPTNALPALLFRRLPTIGRLLLIHPQPQAFTHPAIRLPLGYTLGFAILQQDNRRIVMVARAFASSGAEVIIRHRLQYLLLLLLPTWLWYRPEEAKSRSRSSTPERCPSARTALVLLSLKTSMPFQGLRRQGGGVWVTDAAREPVGAKKCFANFARVCVRHRCFLPPPPARRPLILKLFVHFISRGHATPTSKRALAFSQVTQRRSGYARRRCWKNCHDRINERG